MKKISAHEIALSALSCAIATIFLTLGVYSAVLLFTGYLLACTALMLPLAKKSYVGYVLSYIATCVLCLLLVPSGFFDLLPFIMFFGLHPLVNELQLKVKINRWLAFAIKALWFDVTTYLIWRFVFGMTTTLSMIDEFILPVILFFGTAFFLFYDYTMYKARYLVNRLVERITKK